MDLERKEGLNEGLIRQDHAMGKIQSDKSNQVDKASSERSTGKMNSVKSEG
jgi:hypothetical protein